MNKRYNCKEKFFEIDNEGSFYWAGFIAADGNISKDGDFTLSLKIEDYNHLVMFKNLIVSDAPIKILPPRKKIINGIETQTSGTAIIRFRSKQWLYDLQRFNIIPNKTSTYDIPQQIINHKYFKHFIRGYFDGDGWFSIRKHKNNKQRLSWGICGNFNVCKNIQKHIVQQCDIFSIPNINKQKNIFRFEFQNQHDVHNIITYLYESTIYLDRKYQISKLSKQCDEQTIILNLDRKKLQELYDKLKSYKLIAQELGCCKSSVHNYIKKYGIKKITIC